MEEQQYSLAMRGHYDNKWFSGCGARTNDQEKVKRTADVSQQRSPHMDFGVYDYSTEQIVYVAKKLDSDQI